jgi:hypothetical protein
MSEKIKTIEDIFNLALHRATRFAAISQNFQVPNAILLNERQMLNQVAQMLTNYAQDWAATELALSISVLKNTAPCWFCSHHQPQDETADIPEYICTKGRMMSEAAIADRQAFGCVDYDFEGALLDREQIALDIAAEQARYSKINVLRAIKLIGTQLMEYADKNLKTEDDK